MAIPRQGSYDLNLQLWYYKQDAPKKAVVESKFGSFENVVEITMDTYKKSNKGNVFQKYPMTVVDGRNHLPGGKEAWDFNENGFTFVTTPEYEFEDHLTQNRRRVNEEFAPAACEVVKKATGAKQVLWMSHQRRAENGTPTEGYARGAGHSDYGPENEAQFRGVLAARYGIPKEEAQSCGLCIVNMWNPVERPAYQNPLCLLDGGSVNMATETVRYKSHESVDNGYGYYNGYDTKKSLKGLHQEEVNTRAPRPLEERVPQAAMDAPALGPSYAPHHRWVYLPDMLPSEAVVFKQIDFRKQPKAKATFHCAIDDRHHQAWKQCPGRRSIESRFICIFDPETPTAKL